MTKYEPQSLLLARLKVLPPSTVCDELKALSESYRESRHSGRWDGFDKVQEALFARRDPLIDLALAKYGTEWKVVEGLYATSPADGSDPQHNRGVRIAVLSLYVIGYG
jgi:hypothetical protein